jgi:DNA-binding LacI/PurR family transcriptional regulator
VGAGRVTLQTIADALGVSRTTVSNAYNRPDQLAPELRERILARARELGYAGPDAAARRLRSGRRDAFGLLFTDDLGYAFNDPAAVLLLQGVAGVVEDEGVALLIMPTGERHAPRELIRDAVVDGFCAYSFSDDHPALEAVLERRLPLVVVDEPRLPRHHFVGIDDRGGAREVARHVVSLGHRRIGVVVDRLAGDGFAGFVDAGRRAAATYRVTRERIEGFAEGLAEAGIELDRLPVLEQSSNRRDFGRAGAAALLERDPEVTAVLAMTDELALGAMEELRARGIDVPGRVSVTGFDDVPEAAVSAPSLTTVRQPLRRKGEEAGRLLIHPPAEPREVLLPVDLVVRHSTGIALR